MSTINAERVGDKRAFDLADNATPTDGVRATEGDDGAWIDPNEWDPNAIGALGYPRWIELNMMLDFQVMFIYNW